MPRISNPTCPSCGADLPIVPGATVVTCTYCNNQVMLKHTQHGMPAPPAPVRIRITGGDIKKFAVAMVVFPIIMILAGIAITVVCVVHKVKKTADEVSKNVTNATSPDWIKSGGGTSSSAGDDDDGDSEPPRVRERLRWVYYTHKTSARINSDDIDDFIGLAYYPNEDNEHYVIGVDGATFQYLWKAGPYGTNKVSASSNTHFAVMGDRLLVTDHKSMARVLDLATGKELRATALTDRGEWICPHKTDPDRAWIDVADNKHVWLTLSTGALAPQKKRPPHCLEWHERTECRPLGRAECVSDERFREPEGTSMDVAMRDGGHLVAVGYKQPGTNHSMVAALEANGKATKWLRRVIDTHDTADVTGEPDFVDMADGVVYVYYELGSDNHHLIAIDAETSKTVWDAELPGKDRFDPDPEGLVASPTRLFLMSGEVVYALSPEDGSVLGQIGDRW